MRTFTKIQGLLIVLLIVFTTQCERQAFYEEISVDYMKCPCNKDQMFIKSLVQNDVMLFDANKLSLDEMMEKTQIGNEAEFICYFPEKDSALYYNFQGFTYIGYICNFPESAMEWFVPEGGFLISFSADEYDSCDGCNAIGLNSCGELVLKTLNRRKL